MGSNGSEIIQRHVLQFQKNVFHQFDNVSAAKSGLSSRQGIKSDAPGGDLLFNPNLWVLKFKDFE